MQSYWLESRRLEGFYTLRQELRHLLQIAKDQYKAMAAYGDELSKEDLKAKMEEIIDSGRIALLMENGSVRTWVQYKKAVLGQLDAFTQLAEDLLTVLDEAKWLTDKFGAGEYQDIPGLCKMASRAEIAEKNYSLTPGAYVGVAAVEDDGVDFAQRMGEIHNELLKLQAESNELMRSISKNMKEMGL